TIGIELSRGRHETDVAFPDEIHQWHAPVLVLLGNRDHEPHVVPGKPFLGSHIAPERLACEGLLLVHGEQRNPADLVEVEVQALTPVVQRPRQGCGLGLTANRTLGVLDCCHVCSLSVVSAAPWTGHLRSDTATACIFIWLPDPPPFTAENRVLS